MFQTILYVAFLILDKIIRLYRIEEELSHARLTLHAASALKTRRRKGREGLKTLNHEEREEHEGKMNWKFFP